MSLFSALDISPVSRVISIGGKPYKIECNMRTLARAEQIYATKFERDINATLIIGELLNGKSSALMAVAYAALTEGGTVVTWDVFGKEMFGSKDFDLLFDEFSSAITDMFGLAESGDTPEGEGKN